MQSFGPSRNICEKYIGTKNIFRINNTPMLIFKRK